MLEDAQIADIKTKMECIEAESK